MPAHTDPFQALISTEKYIEVLLNNTELLQFDTIARFHLEYNVGLLFVLGAEVAQSVQCLTTDWTTYRSGFDLRQEQKAFSSNLCVQTGSEAHPASCTMGTGGPFPGVKCGRGVMLTTHPHLVPRSWMSRSYTASPPKQLHGA
jgi:hypothetical protein